MPTVDDVAAGLCLLLLDDFEYWTRVAAGRGLDELFGNRPGHNEIRALAEGVRARQPQLRVKAGQLRQLIRVGNSAGTRLAVLQASDALVDQGPEDLVGCPIVRVITDSQLVDAIPERLAMPECLHSRPEHLQPRRRHPLLAALKTPVNETDLHAGRLLRPALDHLDLDKVIDAAAR